MVIYLTKLDNPYFKWLQSQWGNLDSLGIYMEGEVK